MEVTVPSWGTALGAGGAAVRGVQSRRVGFRGVRPRGQVPAKAEGRVRLAFRVPLKTEPGRYVIPVDVVFGERDLPQFTEAVIVV